MSCVLRISAHGQSTQRVVWRTQTQSTAILSTRDTHSERGSEDEYESAKPADETHTVRSVEIKYRSSTMHFYTHTITHSNTLLITCTCCDDEILSTRDTHSETENQRMSMRDLDLEFLCFHHNNKCVITSVCECVIV